MQELVLDLHLHSRYSRAVSPRMNLQTMYLWGRKKGINILSVTDFTHPLWFRETKQALEEVSEGIYRLKDEEKVKLANPDFFKGDFLGPYFMLATEISAIYTENGRGHRIHNLVFAPNFDAAEGINKSLAARGFNLTYDGRPTLGNFSTKDLLDMLMEIDQKIALIPCHVWTPWFSLYGSRSGYDHLTECFGKHSGRIFAIETGLSSDPAMNWRIKELTTRSIVSFSDAHSLEKMGREATVIKKKGIGERGQGLGITLEDITYSNILNSFVRGKERIFEIGYTIEFYPEEGKYHYTGHRTCGISYSPTEDKEKGSICPVCKRELTVGVMHRVEELAATPEENYVFEKDENGVMWVKDPTGVRPPFVSLVPFLEVLSEALGSGLTSQKVVSQFDYLVSEFGSEHEILFRSPIDKIRQLAGDKIAEGIAKVRSRNIAIVPGFDGEYGKVKIWQEETTGTNQPPPSEPQPGLEF